MRPASVVIADGIIAEVAAPHARDPHVDLGDVALLPGLVDTRDLPSFPEGPLDKAKLRAVLSDAGAAGSALRVHAEDPAELSEPRGDSYDAFADSRPTVAERRGIELVVSAAARTGARAHIAPLAAADCAALIGAAKAAGVGLTAETRPHYLFFAAEEFTGRAEEFRCRPPIRYAANREALWRALAEGVIDCVTPGEITPPAVALSAVWTVARKRRHTLADVARWMAETPAKIIGRNRGAISEGRDADLVAFDPDAPCTTPYLGRALTGQVVRTWPAGKAVLPGEGGPCD